jgi:hypothetical protein
MRTRVSANGEASERKTRKREPVIICHRVTNKIKRIACTDLIRIIRIILTTSQRHNRRRSRWSIRIRIRIRTFSLQFSFSFLNSHSPFERSFPSHHVALQIIAEQPHKHFQIGIERLAFEFGERNEKRNGVLENQKAVRIRIVIQNDEIAFFEFAVVHCFESNAGAVVRKCEDRFAG